MGAVVEAIDGRPIDQYLREEIIDPLGMSNSSLGIPLDTQAELGDRIVPVVWTGHRLPNVDSEGALSMVPYRIDRLHNQPWHIAKVEPGGGMRGPANELGLFYEVAPRLWPEARARTAHRRGHGRSAPARNQDPLFGLAPPFGLGVAVDFTGGAGRRAFGHGGMASSRGLADPEVGLVMVLVVQRASRPDRRRTPERRHHRRRLHRARRPGRALPPEHRDPSAAVAFST